MKKTSFFALFILGLFVFQNAYAEKPSTIKDVDPSVRRFILWRIYTQPLDSNAEMYVTVDSVLKTDSVFEDFYTKEKFRIPKKAKEVNNLKPNTYYFALAMAGCNTTIADKCTLDGENFWLMIFDILPDTPENRTLLNQKWSETKVIYKKYPPSIKGRDVDM